MSSGNRQVREIQLANAVFLPEIIKLLDEGHSVTIRLKGISMRPFLEDNRDKALLIKPQDIKVGDVVLAELPNSIYVLHRIVKIDKDNITLLGDGNLRCEYCTRADIKGFAVGFYRKDKTLLERTDQRKWKMYSWFWMRLRPIRRYLLAIYRRVFI